MVNLSIFHLAFASSPLAPLPFTRALITSLSVTFSDGLAVTSWHIDIPLSICLSSFLFHSGCNSFHHLLPLTSLVLFFCNFLSTFQSTQTPLHCLLVRHSVKYPYSQSLLQFLLLSAVIGLWFVCVLSIPLSLIQNIQCQCHLYLWLLGRYSASVILQRVSYIWPFL